MYSLSLNLLFAEIVRRKSSLYRKVNFGKIVNKIQLIGRIGSTPTSNEFEDRRVYNYTLATSETKVDKEGKKDECFWENINMFFFKKRKFN